MANNNWYLIEPNYDSSDFVEDIIEKGEVADPKIATVYGTEEDKFQHNIQYRDCYTSFIIDPDIMDQLLKYFGPVLKKLKYNISHLESLQYTVYDEGHYYNWHQDNHPAPYEDGTIRKLSMTMFLTDPDEYEGGELEIEFGGPGDNSKIESFKGKRGSIVFFHSTNWHRVTPVTKGTRKSLVGWFCGQKWK